MARELLCVEDVDPYARECSDPLQELKQDLLHRLIEEPDENLDAVLAGESRGLGLLSRLTGPRPKDLGRQIETECEKDARVTKCTCALTVVSNGNAGDVVTIRLTLDVDADGLNVEGYQVTIVKDNAGIRLVKP